MHSVGWFGGGGGGIHGVTAWVHVVAACSTWVQPAVRGDSLQYAVAACSAWLQAGSAVDSPAMAEGRKSTMSVRTHVHVGWSLGSALAVPWRHNPFAMARRARLRSPVC